MALSCYAHWGELEHLNSEMNVFAHPQTELPNELIAFDYSYAFPEASYVEPVFDSQELFYSDNCSSLLPYTASPNDNLYALAPEFFPAQEYEPYLNSKRQKAYEDSFNFEIIPGLCHGFVPNPGLLQELPPEILAPFPDFASNPPVYSGKSAEPMKKPTTGGGSLSAQSIAARQRRRKITEKTQELGKLIPGGQKMNTAEMFQAAFKYIKYLQAQVGILETMGSIQENGEPFDNQELHPLVGSFLIQEKLYCSEKCLVPKKFLETLADDHKLQSNSQTLLDVNKLIA